MNKSTFSSKIAYDLIEFAGKSGADTHVVQKVKQRSYRLLLGTFQFY